MYGPWYLCLVQFILPVAGLEGVHCTVQDYTLLNEATSVSIIRGSLSSLDILIHCGWIRGSPLYGGTSLPFKMWPRLS